MSLSKVTIPSGASFEQTARALNDLVKRMPVATEQIKNVKDLRNGLTDVTKRVKEVRDVASNADKLAKEARDKLKELKSLTREFNKIKKQLNPLNKLLENLKKGLFKQVMPAKFANVLSLGAGLFAAGMSFALLNHAGELQEYDLRKESIANAQSDIEFRITQKAFLKAQSLEKLFNKFKTEFDVTKKNIYGDVSSALKNSVNAREKANDALYEARQGRKILDGKIDIIRKLNNDALYEVKQGRKLLDAQIALIKKAANDALYETRQGRVKLDARIDNTNQQLSQTKQQILKVETKVERIEKNTNPPNSSKNNNSDSDLYSKINKATTDAAKALIEVAKLPALIRKESTDYVIPTVGKFVDGKLVEIKKDYDAKIAKKIDGDKVVTEIQTKAGNIIRVLEPNIKEVVKPQIRQEIKPLEDRQSAIDLTIDGFGKTFDGIKGELIKLGERVNKWALGVDNAQARIDGLRERVGGIEKVNAEGNAKLDKMLPLLVGFPALISAIPQGTIDKFNQQVAPKIPDMAAAGTCRTLQPGGCMRNGLDDLGNTINNNTNNSNNNLFNRVNGALNTGANAAQLALLNVINSKLGAQLTGGLSAKLVNGFKWLQLDRALAVLTFAATIQNHLMLSRDIGTTLLGAFSNILSLIGLKDDSGDPFDIGNVINSSIENLVKRIIGAENYTQLSQTWAKANRIYQATTNVLNSFQNISSTILSGMELIASYSGKIGNALKKSGEVLESAYGWMNPTPKFNRISQTLENLQQGASTIQQVTQAPLDVIAAVTELQTANTELVKALKEDGKAENKPPDVPEPEDLKARELLFKKLSIGPAIAEVDKEADED